MEYSFTLKAVVANPVKNVWSGAGILGSIRIIKYQQDLRQEAVVLLFVGVVVLCKVYDFHRLVFALVQVPYLEILRRVNDEEFAKPVHKAASQATTLVVTVIVNKTPVYHDNWILAGVVPDGDG